MLQLADGNLVKSIKFTDFRYLGEPINAVRIFNDKECDELVVIDVLASREKSSINYALLNELAEEAFMPMTYGGGIKNLEQIGRLLKIGYEKVIINSGALDDKMLIQKAVGKFGQSTIIAGIDYDHGLFGEQICFKGNSRKVRTGVLERVNLMESFGVGEILLSCVSRDGTYKGYDEKTIVAVTENCSIPVTVACGASSLADIAGLAKHSKASGFVAGSIFVYSGPHKAVLINYPSYDKLVEILA